MGQPDRSRWSVREGDSQTGHGGVLESGTAGQVKVEC